MTVKEKEIRVQVTQRRVAEAEAALETARKAHEQAVAALDDARDMQDLVDADDVQRVRALQTKLRGKKER